MPMSENCPKCGSLLIVAECCGGGIWFCEKCKEYYYYGELLSEEEAIGETLHLDDSQENNQQQS